MTSTPLIFPTAMPSSEGSLASRFLSLANEQPKTTQDGFGPSSTESFAEYDPDTSSWKTSQGSLLPEWETYSETWPRSGMTRNGKAYRLARLVPPISGGESSLLPTPQAQEPNVTTDRLVDRDGNPPTRLNQRVYDRETGRLAQTSLTQWVQLYPTPTVNDSRGGRNRTSGRSNPNSKHHDGVTLTDYVRMWPTPKSSPSGPGYARTNRPESGDDLATSVARDTPGQLNPTWVEWLMGFPEGWTDLEDSATQ